MGEYICVLIVYTRSRCIFVIIQLILVMLCHVCSVCISDDKAYKWSCDGSPEYTLEPAEKSTPGTDIVLQVAEDSLEFLEEEIIE